MILGEALALRADLQKRMNRLQSLLLENATVQEGDQPVVQPAALLEEYRALAGEHERLVRRINRTNAAARLALAGGEMTLSDAVVRRERLAREAALLRDIANKTLPARSRFLRTEVKHVPAVDVPAMLAEADRLSREHRELDTQLQQTNWRVELSE
jgi:hypothetical protein